MGYYGTIEFEEDTLNHYQISTKYYNVYSSSTGIRGDATNNDNLSISATYKFPTSKHIFMRGGIATELTLTGIYSYNNVEFQENSFLADVDETISNNIGFRISLAIWK